MKYDAKYLFRMGFSRNAQQPTTKLYINGAILHGNQVHTKFIAIKHGCVKLQWLDAVNRAAKKGVEKKKKFSSIVFSFFSSPYVFFRSLSKCVNPFI